MEQDSNELIDKVFVTYSQDSKEHQTQVASLTDLLRKEGFDAEMDILKSQRETAISFKQMMHVGIAKSKKVIIVLSKGYKEKAEEFKAGVGVEYNLVVNDIVDNPQKYILVSFDGITNDIIPLGLAGREIVDLSNPEKMQVLFQKLLGHQTFIFSEVGTSKPTFTSQPIPAFHLPIKKALVEIEMTSVKPGNGSFSAGICNFIENNVTLAIKNCGEKRLDDFTIAIKMHSAMFDEEVSVDHDGQMGIQNISQTNLFPGQSRIISFVVRLTRQNIKQVIGSSVEITVYSNEKPVTVSYPLISFFQMKLPTAYQSVQPSLEHFERPLGYF